MEMPETATVPRVLVADDEELVAKTLVAILNKSGFCARAAHDGASAVAAASEWRPDILLCDVLMPEMDGIEASIRIREEVPSCRIFLISAQERQAARVAEQKARGYDFEFILKPIHPLELIQLLQFALSENSR